MFSLRRTIESLVIACFFLLFSCQKYAFAKNPLPPVVYKVVPHFDDKSVTKHVTGHVVVHVGIAPGGYVTVIRLLRGLNPGLNQASMWAAGQWRFEARPYRSETDIDFDFTIKTIK